MQTINTEKALKLISSTKGRVFTAVFTKKDGTTRKMNCRLGVKKTNGTGRKYDPSEYGLMTVFDMKAKEYRQLNLTTLTALQVSGQVYIIVE